MNLQFYFRDFQNFTKIKNFWRHVFLILSIHKPSLGQSCKVPHRTWARLGVDVFIVLNDRFDIKTTKKRTKNEMFVFFKKKEPFFKMEKHWYLPHCYSDRGLKVPPSLDHNTKFVIAILILILFNLILRFFLERHVAYF